MVVAPLSRRKKKKKKKEKRERDEGGVDKDKKGREGAVDSRADEGMMRLH